MPENSLGKSEASSNHFPTLKKISSLQEFGFPINPKTPNETKELKPNGSKKRLLSQPFKQRLRFSQFETF
jgi:hypothetical protein